MYFGRVLETYNQIERYSNTNINLLKEVVKFIELNQDKNLNEGWFFVEEGIIKDYPYFIMVCNRKELPYLTAYVELENNIDSELTASCPVSISFNGVGDRGRYCIGIDRSHYWNYDSNDHLNLPDCRFELKYVIDWLIKNKYK